MPSSQIAATEMLKQKYGEIYSDKETFKKIFNILTDKPDKVAKFFIPRILKNTKNDAQIAWLTNRRWHGVL